MHVGYAVVLLVVLTAGCTRDKPEAPPSLAPVAAPQPVAPKPAATPVGPATRPAAPVLAPARNAGPPVRAVSKSAPSGSKAPAVTPVLDLKTLTAQLKATKAIGFLTKITLKNQVDDLLDRFGEYYEGKSKLSMTDLRQSYELLMMKVLSLLQDKDRDLASAIVSSREAIWALLANPTTFATLQG